MTSLFFGAAPMVYTLVSYVIALMLLLAPARDHRENALAIAIAVESEPPLFKDDAAKKKTAALVVAVAFRESSLRNDVKSKTNDSCMMQINKRPELENDPVECVRVGIVMLRESMQMCPEHPIAFYAEGPRGCASARAQRISRDRLAVARWAASRVVSFGPGQTP